MPAEKISSNNLMKIPQEMIQFQKSNLKSGASTRSKMPPTTPNARLSKFAPTSTQSKFGQNFSKQVNAE